MKRFCMKRVLPLLLAVCTVVTLTGADVFAADGTQISVASIENYEKAVSVDAQESSVSTQFRGAPIYRGSITSISQTGATADSVTVAWNDTAGVGSYYVEYSVYYAGSPYAGPVDKTVSGATSYTIDGVPQGAVVYVSYIGRVGSSNTNYAYNFYAYTIPGTVTGFSYTFGSGHDLTIYWDSYYYNGSTYYVNGYYVNVYDTSGNLVSHQEPGRTDSQLAISGLSKKKVYQVQITPYVTASDGTVVTGTTYTKYVIPQPKVSNSKKNLKLHSIKLKWNKVSGAKKYIVYVAQSKSYVSDTSSMLKWKKVATTKKNSYNLTKFKKKTINTNTYYYYICVVTVTKYGKSTDYYGVYGHTY